MFGLGGMGGLASFRVPTIGMGGSYLGGGGGGGGAGPIGNQGSYAMKNGGIDVMGTMANMNSTMDNYWRHPGASGWGD